MGLDSRHEEYREEPKLKDYIDTPERLQELDSAEKQQLLEKAEAMVIEIPTGDGKDKYLRFIQAITTSLLSDSSFVRDLYTININNEYDITIADDRINLKTKVGKITNFSDLVNIGLPTIKINYLKSKAFSICITEKDQQCWINLKLFRVIQGEESSEKKYLYIADRFVSPKLRGKSIGEQLLKIANAVAQANNCELIFATLIPEDLENKEKLEAGHKKAGYEITEKDGKVFAIKKIKEKEF